TVTLSQNHLAFLHHSCGKADQMLLSNHPANQLIQLGHIQNRGSGGTGARDAASCPGNQARPCLAKRKIPKHHCKQGNNDYLYHKFPLFLRPTRGIHPRPKSVGRPGAVSQSIFCSYLLSHATMIPITSIPTVSKTIC